MTNKERIQAHNELLRKGIETAKGLPDAGGSVADPVIEPLEVTKNGLYAVTDGVDGYSPIMVNVPQVSGECDHEVYDLSFETSPDVTLKPKIEKPTASQIASFVNNNIALITDDVELLEGILYLEYQVMPIADGVELPVVWFRSDLKDFAAYYVWQEDIEIAKIALSAMGADVSGVTGEGWQQETETGFRTLPVEELRWYDFHREDYYMIPYGDYYYSVFDFSLYEKEPADVVSVRDGYVLETQDTLCKKDIYISNNPSRTVSVISQDGTTVEEGVDEYDDLMYIDLEIVGDCPDHCVYVEGYAYNYGGDRKTSIYSVLGNDYRKQKLSVRGGYGITIRADNGFEFGEIYTNATIVSQNENEVYISGLRHSTHITIVAKDAGGGRDPVIWPLEVTENGVYRPPLGDSGCDGYSPVTVNVPTGGGDVGGLTKYAKVIATPASSTSFTIENPSGGIAKKVFVKRLATDTPSDRKIQQYIADLDFGMGVLYAVSSGGGARYTATAVNSGVNNGNFMITEGKITLYRFNSSNTWDANSEYEVEIYE